MKLLKIIFLPKRVYNKILDFLIAEKLKEVRKGHSYEIAVDLIEYLEAQGRTTKEIYEASSVVAKVTRRNY